jgi:hypothetical protein
MASQKIYTENCETSSRRRIDMSTCARLGPQSSGVLAVARSSQRLGDKSAERKALRAAGFCRG